MWTIARPRRRVRRVDSRASSSTPSMLALTLLPMTVSLSSPSCPSSLTLLILPGGPSAALLTLPLMLGPAEGLLCCGCMGAEIWREEEEGFEGRPEEG